MSREGFDEETIARMKARIGDEPIDYALGYFQSKRLAREAKVADRLGFEFRHVPIVYYLRMDRLVKIGTTTKIHQRVAAIMPQGVLAIEIGNREIERARHTQFFDQYSHGEWFWLNEALWTHIIDLWDKASDVFGCSTEDWLAKHGVRRGCEAVRPE